MFGLWKKKQSGLLPNQIAAAVTGKVIPMEQVNDSAFSEKLMGDGVAIVPTGTTVVAPCSGKVSLIAETGHAFGMECDNGLEMLVHIGIDTVSLGGKGFTVLEKAGTHVEAGTPIIEFDPTVIRAAGLDLTTPMVIIEDNGYELAMSYPGEAAAGVTAVIECRSLE